VSVEHLLGKYFRAKYEYFNRINILCYAYPPPPPPPRMLLAIAFNQAINNLLFIKRYARARACECVGKKATTF